MKKIIITNNGTLPLPAVKGGAVEALIDLLLDENEKNGKLRFEVYSMFDPEAELQTKKYKYASFCFVKTDTLSYKVKWFLTKILNAICRRTVGYFHAYPVHSQIIENVRKSPNEYAAILLEGTSLNAFCMKKKTGLPILQRIHNTPTHPLQKFGVQCAQSTDLYMGISQYICDVLREEEGKYCSSIQLLYNSISFDKFRRVLTTEEKTSIRQSLGFSESDFVIMFSGRIRDYKGVRELLLAIEKCEAVPAIKLLVVGSHVFSNNDRTPFIESLEPIVKRLGDKVKFTGFVKYNDMYKYYQVADICSFPSTWEEPFALTCLEGITSGKPVVITKSGGMPEIVDEDCAIVVSNDASLPDSLAQAFISLSRNPERVADMGKAAARRAELFSPDHQYKRFVQIIEQYIHES